MSCDREVSPPCPTAGVPLHFAILGPALTGSGFFPRRGRQGRSQASLAACIVAVALNIHGALNFSLCACDHVFLTCELLSFTFWWSHQFVPAYVWLKALGRLTNSLDQREHTLVY